MRPDDVDRFYQGLKTLQFFFRDALTEEYELMYWDTMRDLCTITEWEYACDKVKGEHGFHAVPLPAVLLKHVEAYRSDRLQHERERFERDQRTIETAERLALEASPEWQEAERRRKDERQRMQERAKAYLDQKWGPSRPEELLHQIPGRIAGENLTYTPQTDTEAAKARLRAQIAQVMAEEAQRKEEA